ncbi:MAG: hypothetical protein IKH54_02715 [Bacilli bacterium]|nr:hypothetical protein [Bacilli bacterium]
MDNETLVKLQHFFASDMIIKKEFLNMAPPSNEGYLDHDSLVSYSDKAYDSLIYIFGELKCLTRDFFGIDSYLFKKVTLLEKEAKNAFAMAGTDINKLRAFYNGFISDMSVEFLNAVKRDYVGYTLSGSGDAMQNARTANELLHLIHSFVMNNDHLLQSVPKLSEKTNDYKYEITYRGVPNPYFDHIFANFPNSLDVGWTEVISVNDNKLLFMVRDRGHCLTIDMTVKGDKVRLEYFIPKLCNIDMINRLPGVNKVNKDSVGATGVIETTKEEAADVIYDFISKVPTDMDMVLDRPNFNEKHM